jgi:DNA polymerase IV
MFQIHSWPKAIMHLDADAFFASVMQAVNPKLKGQPVIIGAERGIATAISYEAKKLGVKRGMPMWEIKKIYPKVIILPGDYDLFSLFSQKLFTILREYSPEVEEYSVDEGFINIEGLRRPFHCSYSQLGKKIQNQIYQELGLPVSIGISINKSLAKLASSFCKPQGLTVISGKEIETFLEKIPLLKVWGIGPSTAAYLKKFGVKNALQFAKLPEGIFTKQSRIKLNKPHWEIRQELRGQSIYQLCFETKNHYQSISKTHTFFSSTKNPNIVWAELLNNVESAFKKARKLGYSVKKMSLFLKTKQFSYSSIEITLEQKQQYPMLIRKKLKQAFSKLFQPQLPYRATGIVLTKLSRQTQEQISLFEQLDKQLTEKTRALYQILQTQPKLDFGTSLYLPQKPIKTRLNLPILEI